MNGEHYRLWVQLTARYTPVHRLRVGYPVRDADRVGISLHGELNSNWSNSPMWRGLERRRLAKGGRYGYG